MTTDPDDDRDQLADEIRQLIRQVAAEQKSAPTKPNTAATRPQSPLEGTAPDRSLDEILQKIQRDIKEGQPFPVGPRGSAH
jgi:cell division protein FtsN